MAYVATVAVHDRRGDMITSTRIAATAQAGATEVMERLGAELQHLLEQRPKLPVIVVQDGAPELWSLMEEWIEGFHVQPAMRLIDRYHVDERLGQVAGAVEDDRDAARHLLQSWRDSLDRNQVAIRRICEQLAERLYDSDVEEDDEVPWGRSRLLGGERARIAEGHAKDFENHASKIATRLHSSAVIRPAAESPKEPASR